MLGSIIRQDCFYLRHKQKLLILSWLNDLMTCSAHFNIQSEWSISQLFVEQITQIIVQIRKSGYKHEIWQKASLCDTFSKSIMSHLKFSKWPPFSKWQPKNAYCTCSWGG